MPVGRLVRTGLVGGIVVIYVALVGLLAKVAEINLIGTQVTGARAVLVFVPFLVGVHRGASARRRRTRS